MAVSQEHDEIKTVSCLPAYQRHPLIQNFLGDSPLYDEES